MYIRSIKKIIILFWVGNTSSMVSSFYCQCPLDIQCDIYVYLIKHSKSAVTRLIEKARMLLDDEGFFEVTFLSLA